MNENFLKIISGVNQFKVSNPNYTKLIEKYVNLKMIALIIAKTESNYTNGLTGLDGESSVFQYMPTTLDFILNYFKKNFKDTAKTKELFYKNVDSQAYIFCFSVYFYCLTLEKTKGLLNSNYELFINTYPELIRNYIRVATLHNQSNATTQIAKRYYPPIFYMTKVPIVFEEIYNVIMKKTTISGDNNQQIELENAIQKMLNDKNLIQMIIGFSVPNATALNFKLIKPAIDLAILSFSSFILLQKATIESYDKNKTKVIPYNFLDKTVRNYIDLNLKSEVKTEQAKETATETKTDTKTETGKNDTSKNENKISPLLPVGAGAGAGLFNIMTSISESPLLMVTIGAGALFFLSKKGKK